MLPRGELTRRAEEIAARKYEIPYSQRTSISVDILLDWALRYHGVVFPPWLDNHDATAGNRVSSHPNWPS